MKYDSGTAEQLLPGDHNQGSAAGKSHNNCKHNASNDECCHPAAQGFALDHDETARKLEPLTRSVGYEFGNILYLCKALNHKSYVNESNARLRGNGGEDNDELYADPERMTRKSNERLEFLGDAVLELAISEHLVKTYPSFYEGELSKIRSIVVSEPSLADFARKIELGGYIILGKGEESSGGRDKNSILSDAFEALIGAIFLDGGYESAKSAILRLFLDKLTELASAKNISDPKSELQKFSQLHFQSNPHYKVVNEFGPDHQKEFEVQVLIRRDCFCTGRGKTKKEAEQSAALATLNYFMEQNGRTGQE